MGSKRVDNTQGRSSVSPSPRNSDATQIAEGTPKASETKVSNNPVSMNLFERGVRAVKRVFTKAEVRFKTSKGPIDLDTRKGINEDIKYKLGIINDC